jgi:beta-exotoxin I transport system ATP-binding protein
VTSTSTAPAIEFESLEKSYGSARALCGIDLQVQQGELFGFLGPNGAGKTTAIRVVLDLIRPTAGRARVLGFDAQSETVEARRHIGYLPGDPQFYRDMTAHQLFAYVARLRGGAIDHAYLRRLIDDLRLDAGRPIRALSRGNRQKVALVQALMPRPELVILDEPTSGLDPLMQDVVEDLLREVAADGRTVFFSSHLLAEVEQVCTRAAILREGLIVNVADLAEERRIAPREVRVVFDSAPAPDAFDAVPGIRVLSVTGVEATFETDGGLDALIKELARHTVLELESSEPTLEELFRKYYEEQDGEQESEVTS